MSSSQPSDIPPFYGSVETTMNALRLIHAARQGIIPRITRRLNDAERRTMIKSGAVFVFSVEESGIKRWTDGLLWSPSRIVGNFLVYREINERTNSRGRSVVEPSESQSSSFVLKQPQSQKRLYPSDESSRSLNVRPASQVHIRDPLTAIPDPRQSSEHGTFKPNGLIKKTITVTIEGSDLHLISYYTAADQHSGKLKRPTCRADIMALSMDPRLFRATNFRVPPKVEKAPDGSSRLVENEEADVVECKVEEEPYSISVSPTPPWATDSNGSPSPIESPFASNGAMFPVSPHNTAYSRHSERWTMPAPSLRASETWPAAPTHHYGTTSSSRRDTDGWGLSAARWSGNDSSGYTQPSSYDRSRSRATNPYPSPLQIPRRETGPHHSVADTRAARLPWLLTEKPDAPVRPPSQASLFPTPAPQIFTPQGYIRSHPTHSHSQSYGSNSWSHSSNGSGSTSSSGTSGTLSAMASPQSPFSPPPSSLHSYGSASSYAPSSGGLSSPEEYSSNVDGDYGDA
ncbi:Gti1/Pac2 family-domain-containing protein [Mycena amicta]|nr:Gti1/Pac2 family-domain-containing protein [Mycena amicta]